MARVILALVLLGLCICQVLALQNSCQEQIWQSLNPSLSGVQALRNPSLRWVFALKTLGAPRSLCMTERESDSKVAAVSACLCSACIEEGQLSAITSLGISSAVP